MPEISVILPVYNVENKIRRCIDSILTQTFEDFELIVIDDGSLDNSGEICDEYARADTRIKVIHQENKGASAARNRGIKESKCEFLGFVDSDDYVDNEFLQTLYLTICKFDSEIAMCCYYSVSDDGSINESNHRFANGYYLDKKGIRSQLYRNIFYNINTTGYFSMWNKLFRKDLVDSNSILFDESMSFGEDMLFVMECLKNCNCIAFSDKPLYYYEALSTGLFNRYHKGFIDDIMKCYFYLIKQTKPENSSDEDLIPLSMKYWYYVNRQLFAIVEKDNHINCEIIKVLSHDGVKKLFSVLIKNSDNLLKQQKVQPSELKVPRLVVENKMRLATFVARYQFDDSFWLRKIVHIYYKFFAGLP